MRVDYLVFILLFLSSKAALAQKEDSLFLAELANHVYHFDIEENKLVGEGATLLKKELQANQYTLIGEYHNSPLVSLFTAALIPLLDSVGYHSMALEIGQHGLRHLFNSFNREKDIPQSIAAFHQKYNYLDEDGEHVTSIPFLDYEEDAVFLVEAISEDWDIIGIDQEFYNGFVPLLDYLFDNLNEEEKSPLLERKNILQDSFVRLYVMDDAGDINLFKFLKEFDLLEEFLSDVSVNETNEEIIKDLHASMEIYRLSMVDYKYYKSFLYRLQHFKTQLYEYLSSKKFDLKKDKMLVKLGNLHTAKGTSPYECFDVGNSLFELAALNGNESLHLLMHPRFRKSSEKIVDYASDSKDELQELLKYGKKDKWTIIDLKFFRDLELFYPYKYKMNKGIRQMMINHDYMIIPKMDYYGKLLAND
jgi:hypothetical protein